jgi:hypothetical protein
MTVNNLIVCAMYKIFKILIDIEHPLEKKMFVD